MKSGAIALVLVSTVLPTGAATRADADAGCATFERCYELGTTARDAGDDRRALGAYLRACDTEVPEHKAALRIASCEHAIDLSARVDEHGSAAALFAPACETGHRWHCFFAARLDEARGDLEAAIARYDALCDADVRLPVVAGYHACDNLARLRAVHRARHPPRPRDERVQIALLIACLGTGAAALALALAGLAWRSPVTGWPAAALALLSIALYAWYETGVPRYADIRVDLLILAPVLLGDLVASGIGLVRWKKRAGGAR